MPAKCEAHSCAHLRGMHLLSTGCLFVSDVSSPSTYPPHINMASCAAIVLVYAFGSSLSACKIGSILVNKIKFRRGKQRDIQMNCPEYLLTLAVILLGIECSLQQSCTDQGTDCPKSVALCSVPVSKPFCTPFGRNLASDFVARTISLS